MTEIIERMASTLAAQRAAFAAQPYPSAAERKDKLKALKSALQNWQGRMVRAVSADFGTRAPTETRMIEVLGPTLEANHAIKRLGRWMRRKRRHTELLFATNAAWVEYQPKGVVGVIVPWNFPSYLALGPLIAAIAAGNRVMIKMSEFTPQTTDVLAGLLGEVFPEDEVAVFGGEVEEAIAFGALAFDHLVFTGSPAVGRHVMRAAAENLVPVTLELGGKSPALVAPGADVGDAAKRIAHGKGFNAGQVCLSPDYALVPRESMADFAAAVAAEFRTMYPTTAGNNDYTSIITERHADRLRGLVADATEKGGQVVSVGEHGDGRQLPLAVVTDVHDEMEVAKEEIFGPVLPVIPYDSYEEAVAYIRDRPRPLALYVFGVDGEALERLSRETHAGGMAVNDWGWHAFQHDLPFGGIGNSGMGSYHGEEGFRELSHVKAMFRRHRFFPSGILYPPYGGILQRLTLRLFLKDPKD